jgi:hypothetical protein
MMQVLENRKSISGLVTSAGIISETRKIDFRKLSDFELENSLHKAVAEEKLAMTQVLHLLAEVERRRLYSKTCPSLFEFCTRVLGYSAASAQRRIDAMRALRVEPLIEKKLLSGELNLSSVSRAQFFFREQAKLGNLYSEERKKEVFRKIENCSSRQVEKMFVTLAPRVVPEERRTELTATLTQLKIVLDEPTVKMLEKIKALWSQKYGHLSDAELVKHMAEVVLQKLDPEMWKTRNSEGKKNDLSRSGSLKNDASLLPTSEVKTNPSSSYSLESSSRYIRRALKQKIWVRDQGQCSHPGCGARHFLDFDHIKPLAFGGKTSEQNLRLLCFTHHRSETVRQFS